MTGTGAGIRSPKGETGEQEGTCGVPRRARGRGAGRAPASVERVKCGFWKMRESSNLVQERGECLDQGAAVPPGIFSGASLPTHLSHLHALALLAPSVTFEEFKKIMLYNPNTAAKPAAAPAEGDAAAA